MKIDRDWQTGYCRQEFLSRHCLLRHRRLPIITVVFLLIAAACRTSPVDRPPGYLVAGIESYPLKLDPRHSTDANSVRVGNLIYNALLRADKNLRLQPELAASWRRLDERGYYFQLRSDVRFHDGRPLTAARAP